MAVLSIRPGELVQRLHEFDAVIDARSPAEFAEDRLPDAQNWPVLVGEGA